eukprot:2601125-Pyramimonas_sp.AAC.1
MSEKSRAFVSSSDDASASVPESKSDSAGCPVEPTRAVACAGAAVADGPMISGPGVLRLRSGPPF